MFMSLEGKIFNYTGPGIYSEVTGHRTGVPDDWQLSQQKLVYVDLDSSPPTHKIDILTDETKRNCYALGWFVGFITAVFCMLLCLRL